jgi:hypothetical protein
LVVKGEDGRYYKPCPECGVMQSYLRKWYAESSLKLVKTCKSCSNKKIENSHSGWVDGIRVSWFNKFKISAELRNLGFDIDIQFIADLFKEQDYRCALTGIPLSFPKNGLKIDVSIDRINSKLGYTKDNVQLVHKDVNMMKQQYDNDYFIDMCIKVAKNAKQ